MKKRRLLCVAVAACILLGLLPQTAFAEHRDFGGRSQMNWADCSKGWGYVTLSEGKILKAGEGGKLEDIDSSYSVFNQFRYNRGQNYYDGSSKNATFAYDTTQSIYGAKLAEGKYFYAVYDNANDRNNYKVDFAANFDSYLKQLIKKGDIEVAIVAEANNYNGSTNKQRGIANLRFYSNASSIQQEITTSEDNYDGTRTVSAGWQKLNTDITRMMLNLRSTRKGLKKFNKSYVSKVRVFIRDNVGPKASSCGIYSGNFTSRQNINGTTVYTAAPGSTIRYYVQFDEKIKASDTGNLKLRLKSMLEKDTDKAGFDAEVEKVEGDRIIFKYKVPDNTFGNYELKVGADAAKLIGGKDRITDIAGNALTDEKVAFTAKKGYTVDDTKTRLTSNSFTDNSKKPYPPVSNIKKDCNVYGSVPSDIISSGANSAQPTIFSVNGAKKPVFRIVLDDEIQKRYLNSSTKLKLQVYDMNRNKVSGRYVYANLAGARIVGVDKTSATNSIKSDAYTELYFTYTPQEISGYPMYMLNFAGAENEKGDFVFEDDVLTCGGKLRNISDTEVDGKNLIVPKNYKDLLPLSINLTIDTQPPQLSKTTLNSEWAKKFNSDASLLFTDDGGFDVNGANISLVYYENGAKKYLTVGAGSRNRTVVNLAANRVQGTKNSASVDLSSIRLLEDYPADYPLYLEYTLKDKAGNTATNAGKNDIRVYLDNTAPTVSSVELENKSGNVIVKYGVTDTGVGEIDPFIEYVLTNYTDKTQEKLTREDKEQQIPVTGNQGKFDRWQVEAYFSDTVGNKSKTPAKSGLFSTALRTLIMGLKDSAGSAVSDRHVITADTSKIPSSDATFTVKYGWKKGSGASDSDMKSTVNFGSASELAAFNFASEEIQKQYNSGDLFDGEFTLVTDVLMLPDNSRQFFSQNFYFDVKAPEGVITVEKERDGVNTSYDIVYDLYDDAAEYKNGAYVSTKNIDFSSGNAPEMKLYIDGKLAQTYTLSTFKSSKTIDFLSEFGEKEEFADALTAKAEITFKDKFGHSTTIESEEMAVDFKAPEVTAIEVSAKNLLARGEDTYVINGFEDIGSITARFADNASDKLDVTYVSSGTYNVTRIGAYEFAIKNLMRSDFSPAYDGITRYNYTFNVTDMGKNSASGFVSFILDLNAPTIYYADLSGIENKTNADSVEVEMYYDHDEYETPEDIVITADGAEIADKSEIGVIKLRVTENGTVTVKTVDAKGKTGGKSFEVNCFDREAPVITLDSIQQTPETGASKYGSLTLSASDNHSLTVMGVAITKGEPGEDDFFEEAASNRITGYSGSGEEKMPIYAENGYFGDESGNAYASIVPVSGAPVSGNVSSGYKVSYGALPDGRYGIYAKVSDNAGNVTIEKVAEIEATNAAAKAETEYTPGSDMPTGGDVTVRVRTDMRTQLLHSMDSEGNLEAMKENAAKSRAEGYTYSYGGETKTLTFDEAHAKYLEIARKYCEDEQSLSDEEKYLVKYKPDWDQYERYAGFLNSGRYIEPTNDLLDYLLNRCMYGEGSAAFGHESCLDVDTSLNLGLRMDGIYDSDYENIIHPLMTAGIVGEAMIEEPGTPEGKIPSLSPGSMHTIALNLYPEKFDDYVVNSEDFDKENLELGRQSISEDELEIENPFRGRQSVSSAELYEIFGTDFDLSLVKPTADGMYENPFNADDYTIVVSELDITLRSYMSSYLSDYTQYYKNPFNATYDEMNYAEIKKVLRAVPKFQKMRENIVEAAANKYVISYMAMSGGVFATEHMLTFGDNINRKYALMDEVGRMTELPIFIDWIDHSVPYVPRENIVLSINGAPFEAKYTNASSGSVRVTLPSAGIFNEYRLMNIPDGAAGVQDGQTVAGEKMYTGFTLEVTDNMNVEFDVLNPTKSETELSHQIYTVNCFDRNAPSCDVVYSPQKPTDGSSVNTDVVVSLNGIEDDRSAAENIIAPVQTYTFAQNGTYEFRLTDEAGNETIVPINVDYIDKTPTELTAEFTSGTETLDVSKDFTVSENKGDYRNTSYTYEYKGGYLKDDVSASVYFRGEQVKLMNISDDGVYTYEHTAKSGSKGTIIIKGIKFDKEPPEANVSYTHIAAAQGSKDSVRADITLTDNISQSISLISVSGRDNDGKEYSDADVSVNADGSRSITFKNNGFANVLFGDEAGNTTEVALNVSNLDRSVPRAFVSYSAVTPTNSDVTAHISLSKLADYQIYGENNTLIKDYTGSYSGYITYVFEQNGTRYFKFRDISGNETEGLLASVSNIDKEKPELEASVRYNEAPDGSGQFERFPGAATIVLSVKSANDILTGGENDTIFIQNAAQSPYHTVLSNGRYAFKYMDEAGNFDVLYVNVDGIDTTLPEATASGNPTEWTNKAPTITVSALPKASGIKAYIYQNGVNKESTSFTPTQNGTYSFMVTDEIGNSSTYKVVVDHVDLNAPTMTINTQNVYKGNRDIFINAGEFDKDAFEDVAASDGESGVVSSVPTIEYGAFDQNKPGKYPIYFRARDNAGNETTLTRNILVIGPDDVFAAINDQLVMPNSQVNYLLGDELTLSFVNADKSGNKVSYAFAKGFYNGAQMKGKDFKALTGPDAKIKLEPEETGMYTLFVQTENRNVMVMYVFIAG